MASLVLLLTSIIVGLVVVQLGLTVSESVINFYSNRQREIADRVQFTEQIELLMARQADEPKSGPAWHGYRKFSVERKLKEAEGICSFYLKPHDEKPLPTFKPGQYLTFRFPHLGDGNPVVRCYSLSDSPSPEMFRVTIKRVPPPQDQPDASAGICSNHFHDWIDEHDIVDVKAPSGNFTWDPFSLRPTVLIGGGIGVTPMLSILNTHVAYKLDTPIWLFYGVRHGGEHVQRHLLKQLDASSPAIRVVVVYSSPRPQDQQEIDFDHNGHLSVELMKKYLPSNNFQYYLCGPPAMMESVSEQLIQWGVPQADIRSEAFGPASVKAKKKVAHEIVPTESDDKPACTIRFAKSNITRPWSTSCENLLELGESCELNLDSSCRSGSCGVCQVALKHGDVEYDEQPDFQIEDGCCLPCVARPKGDVELDA